MQMTNEKTRLYFIEKHAPRALCHYAHAIEKHPYFCDKITCISAADADFNLQLNRQVLGAAERNGNAEAVDVIDCELSEAVQAYTHGDTSAAVEELYDTIAVLLRTIDVLEGRQKLGKLETRGEAK